MSFLGTLVALQISPFVAAEEAKSPSLFSEEEQRVLDRGRVSGGRVAGGVLLGALVGFGAGHAVIGSYADSSAWIYTTIDSVLLIAAVGSSLSQFGSDSQGNCSTGLLSPSKPCESGSRDLFSTGEMIGMFSVLGLGVSHLIQAGHVLATASGQNQKYEEVIKKQSALSSISIAPTLLNDGAGIQLGFKF